MWLASNDRRTGNPPFAGKNTIAEAHRPNYLPWLLPAVRRRPLRVRLWLRAPADAPAHGLRAVVSANDVPVAEVHVGPRWEAHEFLLRRHQAFLAPLVIQFHTETFGEGEHGIGVGLVQVTPEGFSLSSAFILGIGSVIPFAIWLAFPVAKRFRARVACGVARVAAGRRSAVLSCCLLVATLLFIKRPDTFLNPQFWAEDAVIFFKQAFEQGAWAFTNTYNGYYHTLPRLVALVGGCVPVLHRPAIYNYSACLLNASGCRSPVLASTPVPNRG